LGPVLFERFRNEVMFKAWINGVEANVLLDNGAGVTMLDEAFAQKAGLALGVADTRLATGSAIMTSRRVNNMRFEIPLHLTISGTQHAVDLQPMSRMLGRRIDAVLGGDMLDKLTVAVLVSEQHLPLVDGNKVEALLENLPIRLKVDLGSNELMTWAKLSAKGRLCHSAGSCFASAKMAPRSRLASLGGQTSGI
jgi:hypothetical protein